MRVRCDEAIVIAKIKMKDALLLISKIKQVQMRLLIWSRKNNSVSHFASLRDLCEVTHLRIRQVVGRSTAMKQCSR